jgi:hypothetical protein
MELGPFAIPGPFLPCSFKDLLGLGGLGLCWKKLVGFKWNGSAKTLSPGSNVSIFIPSSTLMANPYFIVKFMFTKAFIGPNTSSTTPILSLFS